MENKNVIIALLLMVLIWTGYTTFFVKPAPAPVNDEPAVAESSPAVTPEVVGERVVPSVDHVMAAAASSDIATRDFVVDTEDFRAVFTNVGGRLKKLELKNYRETLKEDSGLVTLVDADNALSTFGILGQGDIALAENTVYATDVPAEGLTLGSDDKKDLRFTAVLSNGVVVEKVFSLNGKGYDFNLQVRVVNQGDRPIQGSLELLMVQPWSEDREGSRYSFVGPAVYADDELNTYKVKELEDGTIRHDNSGVWTAFEDKYFMTAAVPLRSEQHAFVLEKVGNAVKNIVSSGNLSVGGQQSVTLDYLLYAGPRDLDVLEQVNHGLDKAIDFGFFDMLARPLLSVLKFCHKNLISNYGVAIILLTVFIKVLFWPLTHKSYKSMRDMQKLQPEMQRLREKYKKDKERMNREIMELYRKNRVNPMGGCLPMFAQIPVFFALYKVLLGSIALRHEPFIFWIQDLAAKDPYYITPLIMGVTMFFQQKMSPTTMDSQQAKIMLFMPVIFTFMFLNFPSGLVIYWLVNNVLTIAQQWFINREGGQPVKAG